jgi:chromosomal replication initiation ATPase DnaA
LGNVLDRRIQVLVDEDRLSRLESEAERRGVSVSTLVREAIDQRFPSGADERRLALQRVLDSQPLEVPGDLRRELEELRARRLD